MNYTNRPFASWLDATMRNRGMTQAELAREVGVADVQVSRWRRGNVTPSVRYLQRIATALDVPRARLEAMAGYPLDEEIGTIDPESDAELQALRQRFTRSLEERVPRGLWKAYAEACEALAEDLSASFERALQKAEGSTGRTIGFHIKDQ